MATPLIRTHSPPLSWAADQATELTFTPTLPAGRTLADWDSFLLTIREDAEFPRTGAAKAAKDSADPVGDGWASALTAAGVVSGSDIVFNFAVPSDPGEDRYSIDIWGIGGEADDVPLFRSTWLTVTARTR